jgi:hypothetical protein
MVIVEARNVRTRPAHRWLRYGLWALLILVTVLPLALGVVLWRSLFCEHVTALVQSNSPDGMFRCTLTEWSGTMPRGGQGIQAKILVERRNKKNLILPSSAGGKELWDDVKREPIQVDDSACRSNYSVAWEYDGKHRTTGLTVFGDYGTPPYSGEIILTMPLAAEP